MSSAIDTHSPSADSPLSATLVIRARNSESDLQRLFPVLRAQEGVSLRYIVVDNDSSDRTSDIAKQFGAHILSLPTADFSWGRALNLGLESVEDTVAILLSTDAVPTSLDWARLMINAASQPRVAGVYGRQVPQPDAPLDEWVRIHRKFCRTDRHWTRSDIVNNRIQGLVASNACAAINMAAWRQVPFDEESLGAEEIPWAAHVAEHGYALRYLSGVCVAHSHRESAMRQARRLCELYFQAKHRDGAVPNRTDPFLLAYSFVRIRCRNILYPRVGLGRRIEGFLQLPCHAIAMYVVGMRSVYDISRMRRHQQW